MTERDMKVVEFVKKYKLCNTNQIYKVFFNNVAPTVCNRRLKYLYDYGYIERQKFNGNSYIYFDGKKPAARIIQHDLFITDFIVKLISDGYEIADFKKSFVLGNIISDAYIRIKKDNMFKNILLEIQLGTHDCINKYKNIKRLVLDNTDWDVLPRLVVVGEVDHKDIQGLKISYFNLNMEGEL